MLATIVQVVEVARPFRPFRIILVEVEVRKTIIITKSDTCRQFLTKTCLIL